MDFISLIASGKYKMCLDNRGFVSKGRKEKKVCTEHLHSSVVQWLETGSSAILLHHSITDILYPVRVGKIKKLQK